MLLLPKTVGPFTLLRRLGADGVAERYLGRFDARGGQPVIVRRVLPTVRHAPGGLQGLESRVRDLLGARHPFLVDVVDWVVDGEERFLVEDAEAGTDLEAVIDHCRTRGERPPVNVFLSLATQLCNGLEGLHGRTGRASGTSNLLHLGLQPGAVRVTTDGKIRLGRYGLVRSPVGLPGGGGTGRVEYLSPEQTQPNQHLTPASDIFALGALLYELVTTRPLFRSTSNLQTLHRIRRPAITGELHQIKQIVPGLDRVLYRALSLNPRHRYQRAFVMREDLRGLMAGYDFQAIARDTSAFLAGPLAAAAPVTGAAQPDPPSAFTDAEDTYIRGAPDPDAFADKEQTFIRPAPEEDAGLEELALDEDDAPQAALPVDVGADAEEKTAPVTDLDGDDRTAPRLEGLDIPAAPPPPPLAPPSLDLPPAPDLPPPPEAEPTAPVVFDDEEEATAPVTEGLPDVPAPAALPNPSATLVPEEEAPPVAEAPPDAEAPPVETPPLVDAAEAAPVDPAAAGEAAEAIALAAGAATAAATVGLAPPPPLAEDEDALAETEAPSLEPSPEPSPEPSETPEETPSPPEPAGTPEPTEAELLERFGPDDLIIEDDVDLDVDVELEARDEEEGAAVPLIPLVLGTAAGVSSLFVRPTPRPLAAAPATEPAPAGSPEAPPAAVPAMEAPPPALAPPPAPEPAPGLAPPPPAPPPEDTSFFAVPPPSEAPAPPPDPTLLPPSEPEAAGPDPLVAASAALPPDPRQLPASTPEIAPAPVESAPPASVPPAPVPPPPASALPEAAPGPAPTSPAPAEPAAPAAARPGRSGLLVGLGVAALAVFVCGGGFALWSQRGGADPTGPMASAPVGDQPAQTRSDPRLPREAEPATASAPAAPAPSPPPTATPKEDASVLAEPLAEAAPPIVRPPKASRDVVVAEVVAADPRPPRATRPPRTARPAPAPAPVVAAVDPPADDPGTQEDTAAPPPPLDLDGLAASAADGSIGRDDAEALGAVPAEDPQHIRAHTILLMDARARGDSRAARSLLDELFAQPEAHYNPVLLVERARYAVNGGDYRSGLDAARTAEQHWARLPSPLVFTKTAEIYELQAAAAQGLFYRSPSDAALLDSASAAWRRYREHVQTRDRADLVARADDQLARLADIRRRIQ